MSLADPLVLTLGGTVSYAGGTATNFDRLIPGKFMMSGTTPDEPQYLSVKSDVSNAGKQSSYVIRFDRFKNPGAGLPVGTKDAQLSAYVVIRADYGAFAMGDALVATRVISRFIDSAHLDKVLRGEL